MLLYFANLAQIPMKALYDGLGIKKALKLLRENGANEFVIEDTLKIIGKYYKNKQTELQRVLK